MRKQLEQAEAHASAWATPRVWSASVGYSVPKPAAFFGRSAPAGIVVVLHLPEAKDEPHPLLGLALTAQHLLKKAVAPAIILLDLAKLVPGGAGAEAAALLDAEGRNGTALSHQFGKPASRVLSKLLGSGMHGVTLLATGGAAQLALKLLGATEARAMQAVGRLVLIHPRLPPACINAQLGPAAAERYAALGSVVLDVVFETAAASERRLPALRHVFPSGAEGVATGSASALLSYALTCETNDGGSLQPLPPFDAEQLDGSGRSLWLSELTLSISPHTKQLDIAIHDAAHIYTDVLASATASDVSATAAATAAMTLASPSTEEVLSERLEVGALILRGSRCVLVRSLSKPPVWRGMRIPSMVARKGEPPHDAAIRAASELCDIDGPAEVVALPAIPPAVVYRPDGRRVWVHALYAARPPPPGPLENQDQSDDEDVYDWYTWPRALAALVDDAASVIALRTLACSLAGAAAAGCLPDKWGGVFGQEWTRMHDAHRVTPREVEDAVSVAPASPTAESGRQRDEYSARVLDLLKTASTADMIECSAAIATATARRYRDDTSGEGGGELARGGKVSLPKFHSLRPLHPARLRKVLDRVARTAVEQGPRGLVLEGLAWLATQSGLQAVVTTGEGGAVAVQPGDPWWACLPRSQWPPGLAEDIAPLWHEPHGDRQTEISIRADEPGALEWLLAGLRGCVLTDTETTLDTRELDDPYAEEWATVLKDLEKQERAEKIAAEVQNAFSRKLSLGGASARLCTPCTRVF